MKLYSYCVPYDCGLAPNPFWGTCTLVVCKPNIRRTASIGDWIVGLGSTNSPVGNISDCVVYAMKVTGKMTMRKYDEYCRASFQCKIPECNAEDYRLRVGDCIYDYSKGDPPKRRPSPVHSPRNRNRDLRGENALLSSHFFYFGDKPVKLPDNLRQIIHARSGHKSNANQPYLQGFITWIEGNGHEPNKLYGEPQL